MNNKRLKSKKDELVKKSREAILAAVQIYNNPQITFKTESFIALCVIGWTYLLHAYFKEHKIDYRYYRMQGKLKRYDKTKYGAYKHWELERCLNDKECPLDKDTIDNLKFLIGIRHEIEHQMTNKIDELLSAKLQACAINFDYYITILFGEKYNISNEAALAIQFSPLVPEQKEDLKNNPHITTNIKNFIVGFEESLTDESLKSSRYAYRVIFVPMNVNRRGQADKVIEFVKADSPMAQDMEKTYALIKETEKPKYRPGEIVKAMKDLGFVKFSMTKHTNLWHERNAKDKKFNYGVKVSETWFWYQSWYDEVLKYCKLHQEELM